MVVAKPFNNTCLFGRVNDCRENGTLQQLETVDEDGTKRIYGCISGVT